MANRLPTILLGLLVAYFIAVLFLQIDDPQLEFYDEARRAVNALEMARGDAPSWLTPSYYAGPDHWGTKPPLLVWSQALWMKIVGEGELAVRLPSVLASLALCWLLIWWGRRDWGSPLAGAFGALVVLCNWQYMGNHGARTGDFDAMLVLFLTAQVVFFYRWVKTSELKWLGLAALAVFLAGMTKGIAGGFLLPGIGLWFLVDGGARKKLLHPGLYGIVGVAIALVIGYYFLRETVDPGYLELVKNNELGGRYNETNENHHGPWYFYLLSLADDRTFRYLVPWLVPALAYLLTDRALRRPATLMAITAASFLAVISIAATKLYWYQSPVLPLLGMLVGPGTLYLCRLVIRQVGGRRGRLVGAALLLGIFLSPTSQILYRVYYAREYQETAIRRAAYRDFMRLKQVEPPYSVLIDEYHPNALFYVEQARGKGKDVTIKRMRRLKPDLTAIEQPANATFAPEERVIICHSDTWKYMFDRYRMKDVFTDGGPCKLMRVQRVREDAVNE